MGTGGSVRIRRGYSGQSTGVWSRESDGYAVIVYVYQPIGATEPPAIQPNDVVATVTTELKDVNKKLEGTGFNLGQLILIGIGIFKLVKG